GLEKDRGLEIANAFFAATRSGDMAALGNLLAADVRLHADGGGKRSALLQLIVGVEPVLQVHRRLAALFRDNGSELVRT
ncbi:hypothetical protein J8J27_34940, partial [Mycobacterium tuberculosis]|nr:hypothetical protein [Mycobacterium tuberculosis]